MTCPLECAKEDIVRAVKLITAIFILHNFLIDENDGTEVEVLLTVDGVPVDVERGVQVQGEDAMAEENDFTTRDILLRHMRWLQVEG